MGNRIQGAPFIAPTALKERSREPLVVSVASARAQIRAALAAMGFRETLDYVCAA